ncbi:jg27404, partial [Pararge aegeria aegeria]
MLMKFVMSYQLEPHRSSDSLNALSEVQPTPKSSSEALGNARSMNWIISRFLNVLYIVNKMFIPIGPSQAPVNDTERIAFLMVMITGCLVVTGAAVASLSLVISVYMRPEETFRTRYRLIMKEINSSNVPPSLRDKVETFYKMYWHKQSAVSATQLLPIFPPSLSTTIYTDIYFKATQR